MSANPVVKFPHFPFNDQTKSIFEFLDPDIGLANDRSILDQLRHSSIQDIFLFFEEKRYPYKTSSYHSPTKIPA